jgi:HK97 family phage prohead protease
MPMFGEHSFAMLGGDPYPVGVWDEVEPDQHGLRVKGRLVGLNHPDVARVYELTKEGLTGGISIAYKVHPEGFVRGTKPGDPSRRIKKIELLHSIDLVSDPSNPQARVTNVKTTMSMPHTQEAAEAIRQARQMCLECMSGGDAPTTEERNQISDRLRHSYKSLTGEDLPILDGKKSFDTLREFKKWLHLPRDEGGRGLSNSKAEEIAELVFKSAEPRDEGQATEALRELAGAFAGFTLPKIGD